MADSLEKRALQRENRNFLMSGRLVLISPFDPSAGFNVGHAMQRNKLIYALSDAALVMSATVNKGGTWAGAIEQLEKLYLVPIFVRAVGESAGLDALVERGALPWPDPADAEALNTVLTTPNRTPVAAPNQGLLAFGPRHEKTDKLAVMPPTRQGRAEPSLADELRRTVYSLICQLVREPMKADEVADRLDVTRSQAERWLLRLVEEGVLQKTKKPVRYSFHRSRLPKTKSPEGEGINSRKGTEERVPPH